MKLFRSDLARPWILLAFLCVLWWVLPVLLKNWTRSALYELQAPAFYTTSKFKDLQLYWGLEATSKQKLIELTRDLARLNAAYRLKVQENAALNAEVASLEAVLGMPGVLEYEMVPARVISRENAPWWQSIMIRAGHAQGLEAGMGVVYAGGVVGRVVSVGQYTSTVELISSPSFRCVVYIEGDYRPITFVGQGAQLGEHPTGELSNIPKDIMLGEAEDLRLFVSSLGQNFPNGYYVGVVEALELGAGGVFQDGIARLSLELMDLSEVSVLKPIQPEASE